MHVVPYYDQIATTQLKIYLHCGAIFSDTHFGVLQNRFVGNICVAAMWTEKNELWATWKFYDSCKIFTKP